MFERKVSATFTRSLRIVLPYDYVQEIGIRKGDVLTVDLNKNSEMIVTSITW